MTPIGYPKLEEADVKKLLVSGAHCGENTVNTNMKQFVYLRRSDGHYTIDIKKTWNHLLLAARVLAGIENPHDICAVSGSATSHRAVLKFALYTKSTSITGNYTSGTLTNQSQKHFKEPRIVVVSDPTVDHQVIFESARMGIPVIAFCNTNCPLNYVDIVIPCNNKGAYSVGLVWWLFAREVIRFRGLLDSEIPWKIMPDMFLQRDQPQEEKEGQAQIEPPKTAGVVSDKPIELSSDRFATLDEPLNPGFDYTPLDTHDHHV